MRRPIAQRPISWRDFDKSRDTIEAHFAARNATPRFAKNPMGQAQLEHRFRYDVKSFLTATCGILDFRVARIELVCTSRDDWSRNPPFLFGGLPMPADPIDASCEVPRHRSVAGIAHFLNEIHQATTCEDQGLLLQLETDGPGRLRGLIRQAQATHPNGEWLEEEAWSGYHFAFQRYAKSLEHSARAWRVTHKSDEKDQLKHRAMSANNLSVANRKLGLRIQDFASNPKPQSLRPEAKEHFDEAVNWASVAVKLEPHRPTRFLTAGLAHLYSGNVEFADQLFEKLVTFANFNDERDELAHILRNERELVLWDSLPSVAAILDRVGVSGDAMV